ncbi:MAG: hypothetical protein L0099_07300 [Acidobacteria bacterium]|nr:hypothetical protein [Acidobacteriota bacterium]
MQDRINQITRQRHDAERRAEELSGANSALSEKIQALTSQLTQLTRTAPEAAASSAEKFDSLFDGTPATPARTASSGDLSSLVKEAVAQALAPLVKDNAERLARQDMVSRQLESFDQAAVAMPELNERTSQERVLFEQIWSKRSDLHAIEDAPILVAEMVRGLLADARRDAALGESRKIAANINVPTPGRVATLLSSNSEGQKASQAVKALAEQGRTDGWTRDDMAAYIAARMTEAYHTGK